MRFSHDLIATTLKHFESSLQDLSNWLTIYNQRFHNLKNLQKNWNENHANKTIDISQAKIFKKNLQRTL